MSEKTKSSKINLSKEKNNKSTTDKKKNTLLKVCIWVSIIPSIISIIYGINSWLFGEGLEQIGIIIPFLFIPALLMYVWGFYGIVQLIKFLSKKIIKQDMDTTKISTSYENNAQKDYKKKKLFIVAVTILIIVLLITMVKPTNNQTYNLSESFYNNHHDGSYLIYQNKLYYNVREYYRSTNIINLFINEILNNSVIQDSVNSMNLDETENKVLCSNLKKDSMVEREFKFIKNNELYYSDEAAGASTSTYSSDISNSKINLSNCKITKLIDDYSFIKNTETDKFVYMYNDKGVIKYDFKKNKIIEKKAFPFPVDNSNFYSHTIIDYENFDTYVIYDESEVDDVNYSNKYFLYKNKKIIYETTNDKAITLLTLTNKYLLFYDDETIYQMDLTTNEIVGKMDNNFKEITKIFSDTNDNYFVADNTIYKYDENTNNFEDILNIEEGNYFDKVYHYGNKLLFVLGDYLILFDRENKEIMEYENSSYHYSKDILYIISKDYDTNKVTLHEIK